MTEALADSMPGKDLVSASKWLLIAVFFCGNRNKTAPFNLFYKATLQGH